MGHLVLLTQATSDLQTADAQMTDLYKRLYLLHQHEGKVNEWGVLALRLRHTATVWHLWRHRAQAFAPLYGLLSQVETAADRATALHTVVMDTCNAADAHVEDAPEEYREVIIKLSARSPALEDRLRECRGFRGRIDRVYADLTGLDSNDTATLEGEMNAMLDYLDAYAAEARQGAATIFGWLGEVLDETTPEESDGEKSE
jgi:hypothetical protein